MFLKLFLIGFCLLSYSTDVYGQAITCYSCSASTFNAMLSTDTNNCFNSVTTGSASGSCGVAGFYCRSQFIITDGVVTSINRGCVNPATDHDASTTSVPPATQCTATLTNGANNPVDTTTCYHSCNSNNCNTISTNGLQTCAVNCTNRGVCDYFSGNCVCQPGFSGSDCSTSTAPTYISCIQCNGLTDTGCESATSTSATQCPLSTADGQKYCYTSKIETYDRADALKETVVVRGCTGTPQRQDECTFTSPVDTQLGNAGFTELTCTNTCEGSNCNTVIPDGLHTAARNIYCVQCEDVNLNSASPTSTCAGNLARTQCPTGSTHCISTVEYYLSDRVDRSYTYGVQGTSPGYELRSVVRGCASAPVTAACTSTSVGNLNAKKVTCTETCQTDGCNTGWPARPICTQCSTDFATDIQDGYDSCLNNPPEPTSCAFPYQGMCVSIDRQRSVLRGHTRHMTRSCSDVTVGNVCTPSVVGGATLLNCNYTCTTDGCNQGFNGSNRPIQGMLVIVMPFLLNALVQFILV
ncbi:uncharacterized protein LOC100182096 [Ciona intestinalis]